MSAFQITWLALVGDEQEICIGKGLCLSHGHNIFSGLDVCVYFPVLENRSLLHLYLVVVQLSFSVSVIFLWCYGEEL